MTVGNDRPWATMEQVFIEDPAVKRVHQQETLIHDMLTASNSDPDKLWRKTGKPKISSHIWRATLPAELASGTHCIRIRVTDMHGRKHIGYRTVRVEN